MPTINQIKDPETSRQKRNMTSSQKKNIEATKQGVLVKNQNLKELYDTLIISQDAKLPENISANKKSKENSLLPISIISAGVMGTIALISAVANHSAKVNLKIDKAQKLPSLSRNMAVNEETHQAIYQMVQCPNKKTMFAGIGVLTISAMGFMGKMFIDGFKDIWVKKQEAKIQKDLQENLIAVETQSFSGKIQIIRNMLAQKAQEFNKYLDTPSNVKPVFGKKAIMDNGPNNNKNDKQNNAKYFALGALTIGTIAGLGFLSIRNLTKGKKHIEKYIENAKNQVSNIVKTSNSKTKDIDKINLKNIIQAIDAEPNYIKTELNKLNWSKAEKDALINDLTFQIKKSTAEADKAFGGDGTPKPTFYSHVNDYRAFFYNYLLDSSNPLFRDLFFGITGITAVSYAGKVFGEGIKDVEVKKNNAQTELELQKNLVSTELRNFKSKKDAAIDPLCKEFYKQADGGKSKDELKTMAENILMEIKNGPPYIFS